MVTETDTTTTKVADETTEAGVAKKAKTTTTTTTTPYELKATLQEFELVKVLNENNQSKMMIVHAVKKQKQTGEAASATAAEGSDAVIIFEKPHFGQEEIKSFLTIENEYDIDLVNDIYNKLCIYPTKPYNSIQKNIYLFFFQFNFIFVDFSFFFFFFSRRRSGTADLSSHRKTHCQIHHAGDFLGA